ncbi:transcription repressor NadR [Staphylococcus massiliensis]|uniref:Transcriptional regulator n=1 Tax=Staphylococcus massiliensis S46 TaxID=1229783 RepID=K9AVF2_9STAP|nr:transcription repressor NadR [Staphylococcus massiliensis]EKU50106.1 hypothetical protein C273_02518 [Staphylococcus massiliensis S46]MCG3402190.1 transcription repressor NadR [Staphylococcus massiliensis]MCG3412843.1 transcription repressor NadR [Staphylococcus massiliensis]PNZ97462.1 transcription repressor NadR [Staphylococcus massiliensis CCUG 55927]
MNKTDKRREAIVKYLEEANTAVSGRELSETFEVSRQIIVRDIATLKTMDYPITSTSKGYTISRKPEGRAFKRVIMCYHSMGQTQDELEIVIDNGAMVDDVFVEHSVYGTIKAELMIETHEDIEYFITSMSKENSHLLAHLTDNYHLHTISAHTSKILENAVEDLSAHGYLVDDVK